MDEQTEQIIHDAAHQVIEAVARLDAVRETLDAAYREWEAAGNKLTLELKENNLLPVPDNRLFVRFGADLYEIVLRFEGGEPKVG
ncbi:hypothetical protein, partial [Klebsiella pneumoniae]|uniref:hypothetical protein n=1 Tax=Klebsiella pneumoniae TaxID=573 RepID=UPI0025A04B1F